MCPRRPRGHPHRGNDEHRPRRVAEDASAVGNGGLRYQRNGGADSMSVRLVSERAGGGIGGEPDLARAGLNRLREDRLAGPAALHQANTVKGPPAGFRTLPVRT